MLTSRTVVETGGVGGWVSSSSVAAAATSPCRDGKSAMFDVVATPGGSRPSITVGGGGRGGGGGGVEGEGGRCLCSMPAPPPARKKLRRQKNNDMEASVSDPFWSRQYELVSPKLSGGGSGNGNGNGGGGGGGGVMNTSCEAVGVPENLNSDGAAGAVASSSSSQSHHHLSSSSSSSLFDSCKQAWLFPKESLGRNGRICRRNGLLRGCVTGCMRDVDLTDVDSPIQVEASTLLSRTWAFSETRLLIPRHTCYLREIVPRGNTSSNSSNSSNNSWNSNSSSCSSNNSHNSELNYCMESSSSGASPSIEDKNHSNEVRSRQIDFSTSTTSTINTDTTTARTTQTMSSTSNNSYSAVHKERGNNSSSNSSSSSSITNCSSSHSTLPCSVIVTTSKPCYVILWRYDHREAPRMNGRWAVVQAQFVPTKWFAKDYETRNGDLFFEKIHVLDQLRSMRTFETAKLLAWCLAGCLEHTLRELGIDNYCVAEVEGGDWQGFPEPTMSLRDTPLQDAILLVVDIARYTPVEFFCER